MATERMMSYEERIKAAKQERNRQGRNHNMERIIEAFCAGDTLYVATSIMGDEIEDAVEYGSLVPLQPND